jgi:L-ascorbate metabolism protein UlaG (beta-lactamase superfamily)
MRENLRAAKFFGTPESCEHMINLGIDEKRVNSLKARVTFEMDDFKVPLLLHITR